MRVSVDHAPYAERAKARRNGIRIDIHDLLHDARGVDLAAGARLVRELRAGRKRQAEDVRGVAAVQVHLAAACLVGGEDDLVPQPLEQAKVAWPTWGKSVSPRQVMKSATRTTALNLLDVTSRAVDAPRPHVFVTGPVPSEIEAELAASFELLDGPAGADGILSLLTTPVDGPLLDAAGPGLRIVANYAAGTDNIDLAAARSRGVAVANTPDVLTEATAELSIAITLALLRRVVEGDRFVRAQEPWLFGLEFMLGRGLRGSRFLVVGGGRIGNATGRLAAALGADVATAGREDDLLALLPDADVVSIHVPLLPETRHLIGARELAAMKPGAVLVNTSRGALIDEAALVRALVDGTIAGAALDVFEHEPDVPGGSCLPSTTSS